MRQNILERAFFDTDHFDGFFFFFFCIGLEFRNKELIIGDVLFSSCDFYRIFVMGQASILGIEDY